MMKLSAQESTTIGGWESYLPYQSGRWVTQSEKSIYYATEFSLVILDKEDLSATFLSKVDGLSDTGIDLIEYDRFNDQLFIVYSNSNLDIIQGGDIMNDAAIKDNSNIIGSRKVNNIFVADASTIYLATDFGILEYRSDRLEFGTTIFTESQVWDIQQYGDLLLASTDDGLYYLNTSSTQNIGDFNQWNLVGEQNGLPVFYESGSLTVFGNQLFFTDGLTIYRTENEVLLFEEFYTVEDNSFDITYLAPGQQNLMIGLRAPSASKLLLFNGENIDEIPGGCIDRLRISVEDQEGRLWYADNFRDFRYMDNSLNCKRINFNSPLTEKASDIAIGSDAIVISSGGVSDSYGDLFSRDGFYILDENGWENINEGNFSPIKENDLLNFFKVSFSEDEQTLLLGTFWKGLMTYNLEDQSVSVFSENNSSLQPAIGDGKVRISDIQLDQSGKRWITNYNAPRPLILWDSDDQWYNFNITGDKRVGDLAIDGQGNKWMVTLGNTNGVFVFNEGLDLNTSSDDSRRLINLNNSEIPSSIIYTVEADRQGDIWVGTSEGAILFEGGQNVFDPEYRGIRQRVEVEGIGAFLLETEEVRTIEVDGADRKWFGTRNGIFVQSPNGDEQIARFDEDNSPLFDNEIVDMAFDGESGKMYIATNRGIQSIRTETTGGRATHTGNVYAFPNPVESGYQGPIAIKGLAEDATVKITDINGRIVFETQALGGQAIWNGRDLSGAEAPTGVYLVFSTGSSVFGDPDSYVTKILLID